MSVPTISRLVLRHTRLLARQSGRRHASTTETASNAASNAASKSRQVASNATSKASEGLSRVTSAAGPAVKGAVEGVQTRVAGINERVRRMVSFVESMIPPTIYYSKVGFEVAKLTFQGQKMSPPSAAAFQQFFAPLLNPTRLQNIVADSARSVTRTAYAVGEEGMLNVVKNMSRKYLVAGGILGAEVLGFFTVGEMIGKFKVVGYRGPVHEGED